MNTINPVIASGAPVQVLDEALQPPPRIGDMIRLPARYKPHGGKPLHESVSAKLAAVDPADDLPYQFHYRLPADSYGAPARALRLNSAEYRRLNSRVEIDANRSIRTRISLYNDGYSYAYTIVTLRPDPMNNERGYQLHRVTYEYVYPVDPDLHLRVLSANDPDVTKSAYEYGTGTVYSKFESVFLPQIW